MKSLFPPVQFRALSLVLFLSTLAHSPAEVSDAEVETRPPFRLNPVFEKPADDTAYVMPVGSGDLSSMVKFDGADAKLHLHLSKTDWFIDREKAHGGGNVGSPGHISLSLPGLDPRSITGFRQQLNLARGAVQIQFSTPAGPVEFEVFGIMDKNALSARVTDGRTNGSGCAAEFSIWRKTMAVTNVHGRIAGREVHGESDAGESLDDVYRGLGVAVQLAFFNGQISASSSTLKAKQNDGGHYELLITAATTYDGVPERAAERQMDRLVAQGDRTRMREEQLAWWRHFWESSYVDIKGSDAEYLSRLWHVMFYSYASVGAGPFPPKFNGGPGLVMEDRRQWGYGYWWQNQREPLWAMGAANHLELSRRTLDFCDLLLAKSRRMAKERGRLGAWFTEWQVPMRFPAPPERTTTDIRAGMFDHPRDARQDNEIPSYQEHLFSASAELIQQMADYVAYSGDRMFARQTLGPWLREVTLFYVDSLRLGDDGLWHLYPANAIESWWKVKDPATDAAGMRYCFRLALAHGGEFGYEAELLDVIRSRLAKLPPLPTGLWNIEDKEKRVFIAIDHSQDVFGPAGDIGEYRFLENQEHPELYPVFPFALVDAYSASPVVARAVNTFRARRYPNWAGWSPCPVQAARLRLPDTVDLIMDHAHRHQNFPYGGWTSDTPPSPVLPGSKLCVEDAPYFDSAGVNATALQEALLQSHPIWEQEPPDLAEGGPLRLLPAVRPDWSGRFQLLARGGFLVRVEFAQGKVTRANILATRGGKLRLMNPFSGASRLQLAGTKQLVTSERRIIIDANPGDSLEIRPE
jgi:hypothetical protein